MSEAPTAQTTLFENNGSGLLVLEILFKKVLNALVAKDWAK